jgi:hypothetical protein
MTWQHDSSQNDVMKNERQSGKENSVPVSPIVVALYGLLKLELFVPLCAASIALEGEDVFAEVRSSPSPSWD